MKATDKYNDVVGDVTAVSFRTVSTITIDIEKEIRPDGSIVLTSAVPLQPCPYRLTERLLHWAATTPDKIFIGRKNVTGTWNLLTYAQTLAKVKSIAQALLQKNVSAERPIAILSENSIEHALIALAALHIGIPYSPIAPAYSLRSVDFDKLKNVMELLTPGLIFVSDGKKYEKALQAISKGIEVIIVSNPPESLNVTLLEDLINYVPTGEDVTGLEVDNSYNAIQPDTVAKILFTSGSTGLPKGVINTHQNISTNWQQITQTFPFIMEEELEFIDWLPWNHTFGGNHNFGLAIYNGGTFYIDDGNPTPQGIETTVANLKERKPTIYFNVPKGFEELIHYFKRDKALCQQFFSNLKMIFYAGAGMPQHVWDAWEQLSYETTGEKILITTGLGCTEACPSALFASKPGGFAGLLGVPVPGLELKLVAQGGRLEARYRGKNIFPGYWRQPEITAKVFDEEGFYCTGDAVKFVNENNPNAGLIFDGRIAEDFKLNTGTWVRVGMLRAQLIAAGNGLIQDAVITGHDNDFIGAIIFPGIDYCKNLSGLDDKATLNDIIQHAAVKENLQKVLNTTATQSTGSATLVKRAIFANFNLLIKKEEITDKGSVNQRIVIQNHQDVVDEMYATLADGQVMEVKI
jgi:feruloyl-CoA synthase